jgi:hypothetical protein
MSNKKGGADIGTPLFVVAQEFISRPGNKTPVTGVDLDLLS